MVQKPLCSVLLAAALVGTATSAACTGTIGEPPGGGDGDGKSQPVPDGVPANYEPAQPTMRRLLIRQYTNAIRDLLGDGAAAAAQPPPDSALNGFDAIGAAQLAVGDDAVVKYESSARGVASAAMSDMTRIDGYLGCTPAGTDDAACHRKFVETFGRLAWRRALDTEEVDAYVALAQEVATELGDFYAGIEYVVATMLESPFFVYQVEIGDQDPEAPSFRRLTGYERAARLSFFLLDTTPDDELLTLAEQGKLDTTDGMKEAARALVETDAARGALASFYSELFKLRDLEAIPKDTAAFPKFSPALGQAMREETLRFIEDLVWERDADVTEMLDADYTFVNAELADLYGVEPPASGFEKVTLPEAQKRGGILGQASFLTSFAHATTTLPTLRGKFVREGLMCQSIPAPPKNVVNNLGSNPDAKTARERLMAHQINPSCSGCHTLMDNIGLGLENYDGIGAFRTTENGATIDAKMDAEGLGSFDGARELGTILRGQADVPACMVRNLFRQGTGHVETEGEAPALDKLFVSFESSGYRLKELLVELVASEAFQYVAQPE